MRIPKGFGSPRAPSSTSTHQQDNTSRSISANIARTSTDNNIVSTSDIQAYHKVKAFMIGVTPPPTTIQPTMIQPNQMILPPVPPPVQPAPTQSRQMVITQPNQMILPPVPPPAPPTTTQPRQMVITPTQNPTTVPPLRAYHVTHQPITAPRHQHSIQPAHDPLSVHPHPFYQQPPAYSLKQPTAPHTERPSMSVVRANVARLTHAGLPAPTDDDLIAAGMRYYATQSGRQDFC